MGVHVARYTHNGATRWGVVREDRINPINGDYATLAEFLEGGRERALAMAADAQTEGIDVADVALLSPVTAPCNIICQGLNYRDHLEETGMKPPKFNLLFMKPSSSLSGPRDNVVRPSGVQLLDYELELGLVIGEPITAQSNVTRKNLAEFVAGVVITNDVSARDIQIPQGQWFKGKGYRTFCPTGPYLYLIEEDDVDRLFDIEIKLEVNDEVRQKSKTDQMLYTPEKTLSELSALMDLQPGDLIQTGTPGGVAVSAPPAAVQRIMRFLLNEEKLMNLFVSKQLNNKRYLRDGDVMRLTMRSTDGVIDLGTMETRIVAQ